MGEEPLMAQPMFKLSL